MSVIYFDLYKVQYFRLNLKQNKYISDAFELSKSNLESQFLQLESKTSQHTGNIQDVIDSVKAELLARVQRIEADCGVPLSVCFSAVRDDDYLGKGEENLKFSACRVNVDNVLEIK